MTLTNDFALMLGGTALRATALLTVTALAALLLRRSCAAHRHLIWTLGLLGTLCLVPLSLALPRLDLALLLPAPIHTRARPPVPATAGEAALPPVAAPNRGQAPATTVGELPRPAWPLWVALAWLSGCLLALARLLRSALAVHKIARASTPIVGGPLADSVLEVCRALPLDGPADFRRASAPGGAWVPMSWGLLRPTVILPAGAEQWPPERVHAALLHEMAHVHRRDWAVQVLAEFACALYWFHPLVWIAARQARAEGEHACDDLVIGAGVGPADYAGHLVGVARSARARRAAPVAAVAMVRPSALGRRLGAVLDPSIRRGGRTPQMVAAALALAAACVCSLAALGPVGATVPGGAASAELRGQVVVIDPGHGGLDTGAVGADAVTEKALNLAVAQRLRAELERRGATVYLTRDGDTYLGVRERPRLAAEKHADYLISLHCDNRESRPHGGPGMIVYYHGHLPLERHLAGSIGAGVSQSVDEPSRVVSDQARFPTGFGVLRGAAMPAVLVECGDMAIPNDLARLRDPQGQQRIAAGIAAGLSTFHVASQLTGAR